MSYGIYSGYDGCPFRGRIQAAIPVCGERLYIPPKILFSGKEKARQMWAGLQLKVKFW
jgi:hypothetical protein